MVKFVRKYYWGILAVLFLLSACKTTRAPLTSTPSAEQPKITNKGLLWKVEGPKSKTSYVFGTIHMIEESSYFFTPEMEQALKSTEELVLEIDLESAMNLGAQIAMLQKALMKNDTTLKDLLTPEDYQIVKDHFQKMGIPFFLFEKVKPMFLTIFASEDLFSGGEIKMDEIKSYELELVAKAKTQNIPVSGLETVEFQMSIFDSIPYKAQAEMLVTSITSESEEESVMDTLIYHYKSQNLDKLDELLNSDPTTLKYRRILLDQRNSNWIPGMTARMAERPVFFAVGAGHLGGSTGVLQLLRNMGYQLTPVLFSIPNN